MRRVVRTEEALNRRAAKRAPRYFLGKEVSGVRRRARDSAERSNRDGREWRTTRVRHAAARRRSRPAATLPRSSARAAGPAGAGARAHRVEDAAPEWR